MTLAEYEQVETAYVKAFTAFASESNVGRLQIRDLETGDGLEEGAILSLDEAGEVVGRMLREEVICKLEGIDSNFALHVGFDLYMYIGSTRPCPRATEVAGELGLFVEDWPSPQIADDR